MPAAVGIPIEDFWARARPVQIASVPTLVFGHEDLLLHLTMHLKADAFVGRVRTLCDIGATCRRYGDAIDWNQLIARAYAYDLAKPLYYALSLARELIGARVPSQAVMALRASFYQLPLEDHFIAERARRAVLRDPQTTSRLASVAAFGVCSGLSSRSGLRELPATARRTSGTITLARRGFPFDALREVGILRRTRRSTATVHSIPKGMWQ